MSWKEYLARSCKRFTFKDMGCPDFWVDIRGLGSFSHGESLKMITEIQNLPGEDTINIKAAHELLQKLVMGWNLTDPETDEPLPLPKDDIEALLRLPNEFVIQINQWAGEGLNTDAQVPPRKGSKSTAS